MCEARLRAPPFPTCAVWRSCFSRLIRFVVGGREKTVIFAPYSNRVFFFRVFFFCRCCARVTRHGKHVRGRCCCVVPRWRFLAQVCLFGLLPISLWPGFFNENPRSKQGKKRHKHARVQDCAAGLRWCRQVCTDGAVRVGNLC